MKRNSSHMRHRPRISCLAAADLAVSQSSSLNRFLRWPFVSAMSLRAVRAVRTREDHISSVLELLRQLDDEALAKVVSFAQAIKAQGHCEQAQATQSGQSLQGLRVLKEETAEKEAAVNPELVLKRPRGMATKELGIVFVCVFCVIGILQLVSLLVASCAVATTNQSTDHPPCQPINSEETITDQMKDRQRREPEKWTLTIDEWMRVVDCCKESAEYHSVKAKKRYVSMYDLCNIAVKPWTEGTGCSVAVLMSQHREEPAKLMLSHAWAEDVARS